MLRNINNKNINQRMQKNGKSPKSDDKWWQVLKSGDNG